MSNPAYLIDTHVLLWLDGTPDRIGNSVLHLLDDADNEVYVSAASLWEVGIKVSRGKLTLNSISGLPRRHGFLELPVTGKHTDAIAKLPFHHSDPFDRMLIAQAQVESLILVTSDKQMLPYDVPIISV